MLEASQVFYNLRQECKRRMKESLNDTKDCSLIWDGIMCWPKTSAGTLRILPCPEYFGFNSNTLASKQCTENGTWFVHDVLNTTWTNYTQCKRLYDLDTAIVTIRPIEDADFITTIQWWLPKIKTLNYIGYGLSLTTLILAVVIFSSFKKLRCARNRLHLHLFVSFILKAFMVSLKDYLFIDGIAMDVILIDGKDKYVKEHNFWICKAITSAWQYSIMTNYALILMEGIYLHNLLFYTLFSDQNHSIYLYSMFGWGLPVCFLIPWITLKILYEDELCWTRNENKYYQLFIHVPVVISILINFVLFTKIIRIVRVKLNTIYMQQQQIKYKRLIRSTLILMPLFGVPYMFSILTWYSASINQTIEFIWIVFDQTFTSLQGCFVASLYCLLNIEVRNELKRCFLMCKNQIQYRNDQCIAMYSIRGNER